MIMRGGVRKLSLVAHVVASVGWLGAVVSFFALSVTALLSSETESARAFYQAMEFIAWYVILPFNLASLLSGLVQSLGTSWGIFRHYWVLIKLFITIIATGALIIHLGPISEAAKETGELSWTVRDLSGLRAQLVVESGAAIAALLVATVLSIYKPRGMTRYGWRKQQLLTQDR